MQGTTSMPLPTTCWVAITPRRLPLAAPATSTPTPKRQAMLLPTPSTVLERRCMRRIVDTGSSASWRNLAL